MPPIRKGTFLPTTERELPTVQSVITSNIEVPLGKPGNVCIKKIPC